MSSQPKSDSWYHSPEFDAQYRRGRANRLRGHRRTSTETIADPAEISSAAESSERARERYFSGETHPRRKKGLFDLAMQLPQCNDLELLADTFGASSKHLAQAIAMERLGLKSKAKRFLLCERLGHRVNCSDSPSHRFFEAYRCHNRYCEVCGPLWFRSQFSELMSALGPVVQHLFDEGAKHGQEIAVAKIDFTVPNTGRMPTPDQVRQFHEELRLFWRAVERFVGLSRQSYGQAGCDEFGGMKTPAHPLGNTNLHRHCVYVGPYLPQKRRELSALWSIVGLPRERRKEMFRFVRKHGLGAAWDAIERSERRFVSIKLAESFGAALAHALKYPAKFITASTPERLAQLEAAFHGTRRFSTGGAFYNVKVTREPGDDSPIGSCPLCGGRLCEVVEPWVSVFVLKSEGRQSIGEVRSAVEKAKLFSGTAPP